MLQCDMPHHHFSEYLPHSFFNQAPERVARDLIGAILVKNDNGILLRGRIVETEAYLSLNDAASHSHKGKTARNEPMFGQAGTLYVYKIYGIHLCANIVTEPENIGSAVLLRATEPLEGIEQMQQRRGIEDIHALCNGPGKLAQAWNFQLSDNGRSVCSPNLFLLPALSSTDIGISSRVGITKDTHLPLRFYESASAFVSKGTPSAR
jgi:DNA-3-methyladenine glycosylase